MTSLKATTHTRYVVEVPIMPTSVEQSTHGPFSKEHSFADLDVANRYFDSLMVASGDTFLAKQRHNITLTEITSTLLRQGAATFKKSEPPAQPKPRKK